jgi:NAD(P)H-hydrate epimerase
MKLFTREQLRAWDQVTIGNFYEASSDLMEHAGSQCALALLDRVPAGRYVFFCGTGNNGGDGLVMARLLHEEHISVQVHIIGEAETGSPDFRLNLQRALDSDVPLKFIHEMPDDEFEIGPDDVLVDAIIGTGLKGAVEDWRADLIEVINGYTNPIVSIDIPSGLDADCEEIQEGSIVEAAFTFTLEVPKRAMLFSENDPYVGKLLIVALGLDRSYVDDEDCNWQFVTDADLCDMLRPFAKFRHKGDRGHLQIIAGSRGMMGAAMLASYSSMRTGVGKVSACVPDCGVDILQTSVPEVICRSGYGENVCEHFEAVEGASALVIGPGSSTGTEVTKMIDSWLRTCTLPSVVDADALNIIAREGWLERLPQRCIITPHVGEFDRLFGKHYSSFDRLQTQLKMAGELKIFIVLKGAHTRIATPNGFVYFNSTGNAGMATAGSGDVLSGMIGSFLAQGYEPLDAALLGTFLHGLAGDFAAESRGMDSTIARDIIEFIGDAYMQLRSFGSETD